MNLWRIFPESILSINGIFYLPYLAVFLYALVLLTLVMFAEQRAKLILFVLVTAITNIIIVMTIGPDMGDILIPLLLLIIMALPLFWLIPQCIVKNKRNIYIFSIVTIAGWVHSLGWVVWIFALAHS